MDGLEHSVIPKKEEDDDVEFVYSETMVKQEVEETHPIEQPFDGTLSINGLGSYEQPETNDNALVGKLKVRSFASLSKTHHPPFHQVNPYNGNLHSLPQAPQGFPLDLAFPHKHKLSTTNNKTVSVTEADMLKKRVTELYTNQNNSVQFSLNNNCYPVRANFPNIDNVGRYISKQSPVQGSISPSLRTAGISKSNSSSPPVNMRLLEPPTNVRVHCQLLSVGMIPHEVQTPTVSSSCDPKMSSPRISSTQVDTDFTLSTSNESIEIETKSEITLDSSLEHSADLSLVNSSPTKPDVIVKDELDLGVSTGENIDQNDLNKVHDFGDHFLSSCSKSTDVPANPSTSIDSVATSELDSASKREYEHEQPNLNDTTQLMSDIMSSRYKGVDPEDLIPPSKPNGKRLCKCCDFRHNSDDAMKKHSMQLHSKKYNFCCFLCFRLYQFPSYQDLKHHVATIHRGEKRTQCKKCGTSLSKWGIKHHMKNTCRVIDPFACHLCTFTCHSMAILQTHFSKHDETIEECPICFKKVKKSRLKQHMYQHNTQRNYKKCIKCDFVTYSKAKLLSHYRISCHNKKFQCHLCKFACNSEEAYENHLKTCDYDKTQPFKCTFPECGRRFRLRQTCLSHVATHNYPEKTVFRCQAENCDFETVINATFVRHMKLTNHHRLFKCPDCTLRFSREKTLADHIQRVHVEKIVQKQGFSPQYEDHDSNLYQGQNGDDVDEEDPYAHFKKGWLGLSCFEEDESTVSQQPGESNTLSAERINHEPSNGEPEFPQVIPEINCIVQTSEASGSSDMNYNVQPNENELYCATEPLPTISHSSGFSDYFPPVSAIDVCDVTIKSDPDLNDESPEIECGENIIVTPSLNDVQDHMNSSESQITLNSSGESSDQVDESTIKCDPDSSDNYISSSAFPSSGMECD